jgi:hypothetical protein
MRFLRRVGLEGRRYRTKVTEDAERGLRLAGEPNLVDTAAVGGKLRELGKASHRGHRGHREGIKVGR